MPNTLNFNITLPARVGHAPAVNHWTYHHVLPWRYYYVAGYILTMLAKFRLMTTEWVGSYNDAPGAANPIAGLLQAQHASTGEGEARRGALRGLFGNWGTFSVAQSPIELFDLAETMHGPGGAAAIITRYVTDQEINPARLAELCTNPEFGGFAAMVPTQRLDDPGDQCEPRRPNHAPANWWTRLTTLRTTLEGVSSALAILPQNRTITITLDATNRDRIINTITELSAWYGNVYGFDSRDWDYVVTNVVRQWRYVTNVPVAHAGQGECGRIFMLNTNGVGGPPVTHAGLAAAALPRTTVKIMRTPNTDRMKFHSA